jgi:hypothetical protein
MPLAYDRKREERIIVGFIAYNIVALLGWICYFDFQNFLGMVLLSVGVLVVYFRSHKFLIKTIELRKGTYRISISGHLTVQNYAQNPNDSFVLHA